MVSRQNFVLAAMAAAGAGARFDPVRLQKFFFLLDRELDGECGCPHFEFQPCDYGPFDEAVHGEVERLVREGWATADDARPYRLYSLTEEGLERGKREAASLTERDRRYVAAVSDWLFSLDIPALLSSIYDYAPDMAAQSIRPQVVARSTSRRSMHPFLEGMARSLDWAGTFERYGRDRPTGATALGRHWAAVGGYLRDAMVEVERTREAS